MKTDYKHTFHCNCGKSITVELSSNNSYNVGEAVDKTGWTYGSCEYTQRAVWLCPECAEKAKKLAKELYDLTGTPYYYVRSLLEKELVDKWSDEHK
jgi:hypothetical protein